jgi:hypothetical protein
MAKPAPSTMTKEYQEQTNEYLKVNRSLRLPRLFILGDGRLESTRWSTDTLIGTKLRTHHRYLIRGLQGQGYGPEQACAELDGGLFSTRLNRFLSTQLNVAYANRILVSFVSGMYVVG